MPSSEAFSASTASRPASVTIASAPFVGRDGGRYRTDCCFGKAEYFFKRDWTTQISLMPKENLPSISIPRRLAGGRFLKFRARIRVLPFRDAAHPLRCHLENRSRHATTEISRGSHWCGGMAASRARTAGCVAGDRFPGKLFVDLSCALYARVPPGPG